MPSTQLGTPAVPKETADRFHSLDAVRAFALLLGVFFHAAESFGANNHYWAVVDCSPSTFLERCRHASHSFRMSLFFLIAGFFARLVMQKKGVGGFVRDRVGRILIPLIVGWVVLYPIVVCIWLWGKSLSGELGSIGIPPEAQGMSPPLLTVGFIRHLGFVRHFDLTHLWFLHQLLAVYAAFLLLRYLCLQAVGGQIVSRLDRTLALNFSSWRNSLVLALTTVPVLVIMRSWDIDTPKSSLIPYLPTTLLYGWMFTIGWFLHRQPELLEKIRPQWKYHLVMGVALTIATLKVGEWLHSKGPAVDTVLIKSAYTFLYGVMMWSFTLGFTALFVRFCSGYSAWRRYVADSSYWIYLAHIPIIVSLQVAVGRLPFPWEVKYPAILLITFVVLFLTYHFLVRDTFIGKQLNGRQYPIRRRT